MEVILDELTPLEFFSHGGIVKVTVSDDDFIDKYKLKKKYTFFEYRPYMQFFKNLYNSYTLNNLENGIINTYRNVNSHISTNSQIGNSIYVVDLDYDRIISYEVAKFYYYCDKREEELSPRDPYGIKNVCFSLVDEQDEKWNHFVEQRISRGFDDSELWSLDGTISKFIYPRLKEFFELVKERKVHPENIEFEEWCNILEKMLVGFELLSLDRIKEDDEERMEKEAVELLQKYFFNLYI